MDALVVVLVVTNLATIALATVLWRRSRPATTPESTEVFSSPRPPGVTGRTRRLISVEILNPIELAGSRGRVVGLAGSLAPGLTRRIVYDQILKILRRELDSQHVVADVRLHTLSRPPERPAVVVDQVRPIELPDGDDDPPTADQPPV